MLFSILIYFPSLRSDIISGRSRQPPASVTPVLARAGEVRDNIYTQPHGVTRAQVSRGGIPWGVTCGDQGLGQRSLTLLEITNMRREDQALSQEALTGQMRGGVMLAGPGEATERIVKKGLMWVQQDKLFSRWKEMMISVRDEMTLV